MSKIGFITSWNEKCGVSEYSKTIVSGLIALGCEVKVAANYPKDQVEPDEDYVKRFFHTPFMTKQEGADRKGMLEYLNDCDIIHVQFETNLYSSDWFYMLMSQLYTLGKKIICTMHSSGMWPTFPVQFIKAFLSHTKMWCTTDIINFPIEFWTPVEKPSNVVKSFGLGRNNSDHVKEAMKGLSAEYVTCYGTDKWQTKKELGDLISDSKALALIYHPIGAIVSSSAAAFALGTDRPLLITNTGWFNHIQDMPGVLVSEYGDIKGLRENIEFVIDPKNSDLIKEEMKFRKYQILENKWDLESVCNKHLSIYKKILKN